MCGAEDWVALGGCWAGVERCGGGGRLGGAEGVDVVGPGPGPGAGAGVGEDQAAWAASFMF